MVAWQTVSRVALRVGVKVRSRSLDKRAGLYHARGAVTQGARSIARRAFSVSVATAQRTIRARNDERTALATRSRQRAPHLSHYPCHCRHVVTPRGARSETRLSRYPASRYGPIRTIGGRIQYKGQDY